MRLGCQGGGQQRARSRSDSEVDQIPNLLSSAPIFSPPLSVLFPAINLTRCPRPCSHSS